MDSSAIRSRLAGSGGRTVLAQPRRARRDAGVPEYLHREFPEQASEWTTRGAPRVPEADERVAGARRRRRLHQAAARDDRSLRRQPEELVPGRPLFFATAIPFAGFASRLLVESHVGRPTKIEGNPDHPASLGATDTFAQAAVLSALRPRPLAGGPHRGQVAAWSDVPSARSRRRSRAESHGGRGAADPDRDRDLADAGRADATVLAGAIRRRSGTSRSRPRATARAPRRAGGRRAVATRSTTSTRPTWSSRSTPTSSAAGPARCATRATSRIAARR